jgi:ATP phosphoribosyltransferase regulatory subunit
MRLRTTSPMCKTKAQLWSTAGLQHHRTDAMSTRAESAARFARLEAQAHLLTATFRAHGYELVAPAIIQPAALMLDLVGEDLRARTYVFTDQDGIELCLRPDLTVPTCRLYLERHPEADTAARYCYNGPAFRYRSLDAPHGNPREFRQAGLEAFAVDNPDTADAEIVSLTVTAVRAAGLKGPQLKLGDVGLLADLLDALAMPERWRQRLRHQFWRPEAFRAELKRLTTAPDAAARKLPKALTELLDPAKPEAARETVAAFLDQSGHDLQGARGLDEITTGLLSIVADARAQPLSAAHANVIETVLAVRAPARLAATRLAEVVRGSQVKLGPALDALSDRIKRIGAAGTDLETATFAADFGRKFEYYTGLVFEIENPDLGRDNPIAGGGRYDRLFEAVGAPRRVPAVGAAIYTERLLLAEPQP